MLRCYHYGLPEGLGWIYFWQAINGSILVEYNYFHIVRETMFQNDPDSVDARYPMRKKIKRAQLKAHRTWQEIHCNGHEKLGALALQMGGISLPIYGMKDKWGGEILYLSVIPDD
jgi:hypothetical protein